MKGFNIFDSGIKSKAIRQNTRNCKYVPKLDPICSKWQIITLNNDKTDHGNILNERKDTK